MALSRARADFPYSRASAFKETEGMGAKTQQPSGDWTAAQTLPSLSAVELSVEENVACSARLHREQFRGSLLCPSFALDRRAACSAQLTPALAGDQGSWQTRCSAHELYRGGDAIRSGITGPLLLGLLKHLLNE